MKRIICYLLCFCLTFPSVVFAGIFDGMSVAEEVKLGKELEMVVKTQMPIIYEPEVRDYVQGVVNNILAVAPPQPYTFQANVILDKTLNAFASPGGFVFINSGLLLKLENESELAGVLAHEVAHVTQRHIASRQGKSIAASLGMLAAMVAAAFMGGGDSTGAVMAGAMAATQTAMLSYSRTDEAESDQVGYQYLLAAGYDTSALASSFKKLQEQNWSSSKTPAYLSSHPDLSSRISGIEARVRTESGIKNNQMQRDNKDFLRVQTFVRARYDSLESARVSLSKSDPKDPLNSMAWGIVYERENKLQEAEKNFAKALALSPNDTLILRESGRFHYMHGNISLAKEQLLKTLSINSQDYMARFFLARVQEDLKQSAEAQRNYQIVLNIFPYDSEVHSYLGRSYGASGKLFEGYLHLAYSSLYRNDLQKAKSWIKQAEPQALTPVQKKKIEEFTQAYQFYEKAVSTK